MEEIKIGNQVLHESDLKFTVEYNGEVFTLAYPTPWVKAEIERLISQKLGGADRSTFPVEHIQAVEATTYVNELIVTKESPAWFKSAWTCYDENLIKVLYTGYLSFRNEFKTKLNDGAFTGGRKK